MSAARSIALALVLLALLGLVARQMKLLDRYFIFFPERELVRTPGDVDVEYEEAFFSTSDGVRLHGWFVPSQSDTTLVWFHGNAGNISHRLENLLMLRHTLGLDIFIFDYRGYGMSEGSPSEKGMYRDAEAALEYVGRRSAPGEDRRLVLFGRSLGAAVAVEMATRHQVDALVLESPFRSVRLMAGRVYPFLPSALLTAPFQSRFDSLSKIGRVNSPVMVLHGDMDDIVPLEEGQKLYEAANEPKRFYTIEGAGHNDTYVLGGSAYFDALKAFIEDPTGE
ncbi:MAG: alpha/beta hydrolase [Chloroflexi bacterium]|nr:alpha/beta hydrolase [Chloroflexota bacterium]